MKLNPFEPQYPEGAEPPRQESAAGRKAREALVAAGVVTARKVQAARTLRKGRS